MTTQRLRIGISACLLGHEVRYDGGHKLDRFIKETLGALVEFVPVCPEVEMGMSVPREPVRIVEDEGRVRMIGTQSETDYTLRLSRYAHAKMKALSSLELSGYLLKKDSPSCGMERVKVYGPNQKISRRNGVGLFAHALLERFPYLPVEEEGRLNDPALRENFFVRVFAYRRVRDLFSKRWTVGELVAFHSREKLLLLAHDRSTYQQLGRLVANAKHHDRTVMSRTYQEQFMTGLKRISTVRKNTNVLEHMVGYLRDCADEADRQELREIIEHYHRGQIPLTVPITLIRHHVRRHRIDYLAEQTYLNPHPLELRLRNHV